MPKSDSTPPTQLTKPKSVPSSHIQLELPKIVGKETTSYMMVESVVFDDDVYVLLILVCCGLTGGHGVPAMTCSFQYQLSSLGSIQPCCHYDAGDYSNTQAFTVQTGTHSLLGQENAHAGEVSCPKTQCHTAAAETRTQDLSVQSCGP